MPIGFGLLYLQAISMSLHFDSGFGVLEIVCKARRSVLRIELGMAEAA